MALSITGAIFRAFLTHSSHPRDDEATFRISEEDIFLGIFAYIEHLFEKIKPRKVFFLAVDGVAPRAKMNQQRSRRFRTAQEAKENVDKAIRRGEELPDSPPFDSNCITPGTAFMQKLSLQLEYFIAKKVSEDSDWRNVQVILSGHETCGEGEHKIMEFIRTVKAQPDYNPNTRHCLYGLDADLIMLGLLSHDPHFALLREEVTFGPRRAKQSTSLETQTFYLLHISLLREYLELEFSKLHNKLPFPFDLEKIIDDYILLHLFVGNDFLPHLPGLHINEGAIELLFRIYEKVLPRAGGYINEQGRLHCDRLQLILDELFLLDRENFVREQLPDIDAPKPESKKKGHAAKQLVITPQQRDWISSVHAFAVAFRANPAEAPTELKLPPNPAPADAEFLEGLAKALHLDLALNEYDPVTDTTSAVLSLPMSTIEAVSHDGAIDMEFLEESEAAVQHALAPYLNARVEVPGADNTKDDAPLSATETAAARAQLIDERHTAYKRSYYARKMHLSYEPADIDPLVYNYIEGIQWVLHYYYDGNVSWGWFYRYHYAPQVSDLRRIADFTFKFDLGRPFLPFEQLMGVLPPLSKALIPPAFRELMTDTSSPIIDFYPEKYESDLNGKKNSWEAVVKIPFIDERRLLEALERRASGLTEEERMRNTHGKPHQFTYDITLRTKYPSSMPGFLPDLHDNHTRITTYELPSMIGREYVKTLPEGVRLGLDAMPGFPSLKTLPFTNQLRKAGVNVHGNASNDFSMVISLQTPPEQRPLEALADELIGKPTYTSWPYLFQGIIVGLSNATMSLEATLTANGVVVRRGAPLNGLHAFNRTRDNIAQRYYKRDAVVIKNANVLLHVRPLKGLRRLGNAAIVKQYDASAEALQYYPLELRVQSLRDEDARFLERPGMSVSQEYPDGTRVFFLGVPGFGCPARVIGTTSKSVAIELAFVTDLQRENAILRKLVQNRTEDDYVPSNKLASSLKISSLALARLTSSFIILWREQKVHVGLNLKFEAKGRKVLGYTRRGPYGWEYSERAVGLITEYIAQFPEILGWLARSPAEGEYFDASDIFPHNTNERMTMLRRWYKSQGLSDLEVVPLYVERLTSSTISTLESAVAIIAQKRAEGGSVRRQILRNLPRYALLKPEQAPFRVPEQTYELGDRVINVQDRGSVPLAAKGTVVGVGTNSVDVVFDAPFLSGASLGGLCSPYRGATLRRSHVLNLSTPQIAMKWGDEDEGIETESALERTLKDCAAEPAPAPHKKGTSFFIPAEQKPATAIHARRRGLGAGAPRPSVDAATAHLQTLSISKATPQVNPWEVRQKALAAKKQTQPNKPQDKPSTKAPAKPSAMASTAPTKGRAQGRPSRPRKPKPASSGGEKASTGSV